MKNRFTAIFVPIASLALLVSCSNEPSGTDTADSLAKDTLTQTPVDTDEHTTLPSPLHVAAMFRNSGMKFIPDLTNKTENAAKYSTTVARAQNMGVYSADMAYCVLNKQSNEARLDLKTVRDLATQINLGKIFDQTTLFDRFNNNLEKEDSIRSIIADIQYETDQQLEANQQTHLYGVIFSGAWIESMYLGGQVYKKDGSENLVPLLLEQMNVLKSIIHELDSQKAADPSIAGILADMNELQAVLESMPYYKQLQADPKLEFADVKVTKEEMDMLITKIEAIRMKIVNG